MNTLLKLSASSAVLLTSLLAARAQSATPAPAAPTPAIAANATAAPAAPPFVSKFSFAPGKTAAGFKLVEPGTLYTDALGYGFEAAPAVTAINREGDDALKSGYVTAAAPFYFSVKTPPGNYKVTVTLGDAKEATETTIKAELRRLMAEQVRTEPGKFATVSFIVNVRLPAIVSGGAVRIGGRETSSEIWAWDDALSLQFSGSHPAVAAIEIQKVDVPTIFLMGDSTVCDQYVEPYNSWGQMVTRWFKPVVAVSNQAESGESVAGALGKGRFDKIWGDMKPGDYLIIQFGHNDMKSTAANALERFTDDYRRVVDKTRERGGIPILFTPVSRRTFDREGKITNSFNGYPDAVKLVAKEKDVPLIDLQAEAVKFYEAMGPDASHQAFATMAENTHHSDYGSYEISKTVIQALKNAKSPVAAYVVDDWKTFDPSHPDAFAAYILPDDPGGRTPAPTPLGDPAGFTGTAPAAATATPAAVPAASPPSPPTPAR